MTKKKSSAEKLKTRREWYRKNRERNWQEKSKTMKNIKILELIQCQTIINVIRKQFLKGVLYTEKRIGI